MHSSPSLRPLCSILQLLHCDLTTASSPSSSTLPAHNPFNCRSLLLPKYWHFLLIPPVVLLILLLNRMCACIFHWQGFSRDIKMFFSCLQSHKKNTTCGKKKSNTRVTFLEIALPPACSHLVDSLRQQTVTAANRWKLVDHPQNTNKTCQSVQF